MISFFFFIWSTQHVHNVEASSNRSIDTTILRLKMALSIELPWPIEDIHVEKINVSKLVLVIVS